MVLDLKIDINDCYYEKEQVERNDIDIKAYVRDLEGKLSFSIPNHDRIDSQAINQKKGIDGIDNSLVNLNTKHNIDILKIYPHDANKKEINR